QCRTGNPVKTNRSDVRVGSSSTDSAEVVGWLMSAFPRKHAEARPWPGALRLTTRSGCGCAIMSPTPWLVHRHDLAGVENVLRVERLLQRAHGVDRFGAELGLEVFLLALPDAVLAGAGAAHRLRALDQAMHEVLAAGHFFRVVDVADQRAVEIAVTDMADDRRQQAQPFQIVLGLGDAIDRKSTPLNSSHT